MRYVLARAKENTRAEIYRVYVTESLRLIPQNKYLNKEYIEFAKPHKVEKRSGVEVAEDAASRMNTKIDWGR